MLGDVYVETASFCLEILVQAFKVKWFRTK
jgi:hypothetical protein